MLPFSCTEALVDGAYMVTAMAGKNISGREIGSAEEKSNGVCDARRGVLFYFRTL